MTAALQTRTARTIAKPVQRKFKRSTLPELKGTPSEVAWATGIRSATLRKVAEYGDELSVTYTMVNNRYALADALADMFYEIAAQQTEAAWWINNRLKIRNGAGHYNMVGREPLAAMFWQYTHMFNEITLAHGVSDIGAADVADCSSNETVEPIGTCKSIGGRMCCLTSQGWVGIE